MMSPLIYNVILFIFCFKGSQSLEWTSGPQDGATVYACARNDLVLSWIYNVSSGDSVNNIEWTYDGHSQEVIAILGQNTFVPEPAFSHRVQQEGNAGLRLKHIIAGDSGSYGVEVTWTDANNTQHILRRSVNVIVSEHLPTTDRHVHVAVNPVAVKDSNNQWVLELTCGQFIYNDTPPHDVQWITPSGSVQANSGFQDGYYFLLIPSPTTGNYTCRVSSNDSHTCLHADVEASVTVDETVIRFSILEAVVTETETNLTETLTNLTSSQADLAYAKTEVMSIKAQLQSPESTSTFTRWGFTSCPVNTSSMIYSGLAAGKYHAEQGSGTNIVCMDTNPQYYSNSHPSNNPAYIYGIQYTEMASGRNHHGIPCAVCLAHHKATIMIPDRKDCPSGWTRQYYGVLAASIAGYASEYICLDMSLTTASFHQYGYYSQLSFAMVGECGALPCSNFQAQHSVHCSVCSKL